MTQGGDQTPAGARAGEDSAAPAGLQGRTAWRKALAEHNARKRRQAVRRKTGGYRPGMTRKPPPPPEPDGNDDAA